MKIITVETLKTFLDELNRKYGTEFYTKREIDEKLKSSGGSVDFQELARRIPSWQWKVTMPQAVNQTVTATVNGQTYTSDFYAPQGSEVTFSVKADDGYIAGNLSTINTTLSRDLIVTITAATESENVEAGTKTFNTDSDTFTVPPKVQVLKWTWNEKDTYAKVKPGQIFTASTLEKRGLFQLVGFALKKANGGLEVLMDLINPQRKFSRTKLSVFWSNEINEHAFDYDWTNN